MPSQTELDFRASSGGKTQNARLRDHFLNNPHQWFPMPVLALIITPTGIGAAVHSRVADLRTKFGMNIIQKSEREKGNPTRSFYKYEP